MAVAPSGSSPNEAEADHFGGKHGDRLAEHDGLGLDAADTPAEDAQAVDHGGVRVGADQAVGEGDPAAAGLAGSSPGTDDPRQRGQVFQVDLVDDAGGGWHNAEIVKGVLGPVEEFVALAVALELELGVDPQGLIGAEQVHLDRMVDDQVDRDLGIDPAWIAAQTVHGRA